MWPLQARSTEQYEAAPQMLWLLGNTLLQYWLHGKRSTLPHEEGLRFYQTERSSKTTTSAGACKAEKVKAKETKDLQQLEEDDEDWIESEDEEEEKP